MRKIILAVAFFAINQPLHAGLLPNANTLRLASMALKGRALLDKGQAQCGDQVNISSTDSLKMQLVRVAIERLLPSSKFNMLDMVANRQAMAAAKSPTFCATTAAKKPGIMGTIADVSSKLGGGGARGGLGGLGGLISAPSSPADSTGVDTSKARDALGGLF